MDWKAVSEQARDALAAGRRGAGTARADFLERRLTRGESAAFADAYARASFIGGWLSRREAELLFELAAALPAGQDIVELGSYLGRSTSFLALGAAPGATVHAVDPHNHGRLQRGHEGLDTSGPFIENMEEAGVRDRVVLHKTTSSDAAEHYEGRSVGLLFVDTSHTEETVYTDTAAWSSHLAPGCLVAFDDVDQIPVAKGVRRLVEAQVVPPLHWRVGKVGVCGSPDQWPPRVRVLAKRRHDS